MELQVDYLELQIYYFVLLWITLDYSGLLKLLQIPRGISRIKIGFSPRKNGFMQSKIGFQRITSGLTRIT